MPTIIDDNVSFPATFVISVKIKMSVCRRMGEGINKDSFIKRDEVNISWCVFRTNKLFRKDGRVLFVLLVLI